MQEQLTNSAQVYRVLQWEIEWRMSRFFQVGWNRSLIFVSDSFFRVRVDSYPVVEYLSFLFISSLQLVLSYDLWLTRNVNLTVSWQHPPTPPTPPVTTTVLNFWLFEPGCWNLAQIFTVTTSIRLYVVLVIKPKLKNFYVTRQNSEIYGTPATMHV